MNVRHSRPDRPPSADRDEAPCSALPTRTPVGSAKAPLLRVAVAFAAVLVFGASASPAAARWGRGECSEVIHCYGLAKRNIERYGGVLASIDFVETTPVVYNGLQTPYVPPIGAGVINEEEWISWPGQLGGGSWVETGQSNGYPYDCCHEYPFFAQNQNGKYWEHLATSTVPVGSYNHYVLYDAQRNGIWRIYWGCCEVGGLTGWPVFLMQQEAGIEAASAEQPYNWGKQLVAASDGGQWTPWTGAIREPEPGICVATNNENGSAGNIMWSTQPGC
jgi:hypothetical protein